VSGTSRVPATSRSEISGWRNRLCVALDYVDADECAAMALRLGPVAGALKVGLQSFATGGPDLVRKVRKQAPVFLDLKLHDIPAQVGHAIDSIKGLGVAMTTVHASGGRSMLRAAVERAKDDVMVLAVTVLTSLDDRDLRDAGVADSSTDQVLRLAGTALAAGVRGLVCSPLEVTALRRRFGSRAEGGPLLVVPGIRPEGHAPDDQRRTLTPEQAIAAGADVIVVGRPITQARDPVSSAWAIAAQAR
jgi:orotidine-5'-phosphate decarboxylase